MQVLTKEELKFFARIFHDHLPQTITFSLDNNEQMTVQELADRIRPLDRVLADKVVAWVDAATGLRKYVAERLGETQNPMAISEDFFIPRKEMV